MTGRTFDQIIRDLLAGEPARADSSNGAASGRPSFVAHILSFWDSETVAAHLAACRTGRDDSGAWKPWDALDQSERWGYWWEELEGYAAFAPVHEVEVD